MPERAAFRPAMQFFLYETRPTWLDIDTGVVRFDELAKAIEEWLLAVPVAQRMEAMGMQRWCPTENTATPQFCECELYVEADDV